MSVSDIIDDYIKPWFPWIIFTYQFIALVNIFGNLLTIIAYIKTDTLRTPTNFLICNQTVLDLLLSIDAQPFIWLSYTAWGVKKALNNKWLCLLSMFSSRITLVASIIALMLLSVERSVAIFFPFRYYTLVNDANVRKAIITSWLLSLIVNCPPLFGWNTWRLGTLCFVQYIYPTAYNVSVYTLFCISCFIITALMNIGIAVVALKKSRSVNPGTITNPEANQTVDTGSFKITKMLLKVVGVFYLCWMPYLILTIYYIYAATATMPTWFQVTHEFSKCMLGLNSVFNPLIYAYGNPQFKMAFKRLFRMNQ
ncbi:hypothetical protein CAPTEDRAFT_93883 [Capitella teleta]|uniref:G-protein coupled receptors family 1 profile domain-containing protein n=1 Tax=Capitella teleta TaxID=283909 RepID=R7UX85_CAPTE|nr:hypothetical protein CAPTEDRAFT_93883 [Capitella teleta]|eukprot:ELU08016.1 hypothetical protein CAPTEDRAFT_93883 [Capitella teleta]